MEHRSIPLLFGRTRSAEHPLSLLGFDLRRAEKRETSFVPGRVL
jgi:hypothetical protein